MPRFTHVIRVKEKAIPAFMDDRWHPTSLADEASDAKPASRISTEAEDDFEESLSVNDCATEVAEGTMEHKFT